MEWRLIVNRSPRILIVTGEASGDLHGANLASALYRLHPQLLIEGVGGEKMLAAGVRLLPEIDRVDIVGVPGFRQLFRGIRTLHRLKNITRTRVYDVIVLIDSPGMNLRLARTAAKANQHVVYYIAPQVWAWGKRRLRLIQQVVKQMIVILPFEESLFRDAGVPCRFVGHPLLDVVNPYIDKSAVRRELAVPASSRLLGLLPGSRKHEVEQCLPTMLAAANEIAKVVPDLHVRIAKASNVSEALIHGMVRVHGSLHVHVVNDRPNDVMGVSDLLFVASGTATLQAAILGTPMIIVYRVPWLTYTLARVLIKIPYIGLVNIIAGRMVVPELIQRDMTVERLSREALQLLNDPQRLENMRQSFYDITSTLGSPGASHRAAECILAEVQR